MAQNLMILSVVWGQFRVQWRVILGYWAFQVRRMTYLPGKPVAHCKEDPCPLAIPAVLIEAPEARPPVPSRRLMGLSTDL